MSVAFSSATTSVDVAVGSLIIAVGVDVNVGNTGSGVKIVGEGTDSTRVAGNNMFISCINHHTAVRLATVKTTATNQPA